MAKDEQFTVSEAPRFKSQWNGPHDHNPQEFLLPSLTVPDQSLTIPEIIARYTRTGLVPQSFAKRDDGGNAAFEPGFDPLDEYSDYQDMASHQPEPGSSEAPQEPAAEAATEPAPGA